MSCRITIEGLVQGVGFRPFLYKQAEALRLQGWVMNTGAGLKMEVQGSDHEAITALLQNIENLKPSAASIERIRVEKIDPQKFENFEIRDSLADRISTTIPCDIAPCADCLEELLDPCNRRFQYPFISCAGCGPRFTIMEKLPFDRAHTSMSAFPLCADCRLEYTDPRNRRFHAQTISCSCCGPTLSFMNPWGHKKGEGIQAIREAASWLRQGNILALKGIGGYQLAVLAAHEKAVDILRQRKRRPEKPLALMFSDRDAIAKECVLEAKEQDMLLSPAAPIVLLARKKSSTLPNNLNRDLPLYGVMLPSSPLHWLLLRELQSPLVMTSANQPGAPIIIDEEKESHALRELADAWLIHNRPILHRADDSVLRCMAGEAVSFRRGRGLAPYTLEVPRTQETGLAVGGQEKNTFALQVHDKIIVSQHIGDLATRQSSDFLEHEMASFCSLLQVQPEFAVHDRHPDYQSTQIAKNMASRTVSVQHHKAHVLACVAEHCVDDDALALAWDGAGLGDDGRIWGGECFLWQAKARHLERVASLLPFPLIGGDRAAREPRRCALGLATVLFGADFDPLFLRPFPEFESAFLRTLVHRAERFIKSSSVARLFDAVASLLNVRQISSFEGQAAMLLEGLVDAREPFAPYNIPLLRDESLILMDWRPMFREILIAIQDTHSASVIATRFHHSLVAWIESLMNEMDGNNLLLSGGVFQNRFLVETIKQRATARGWQVWSQTRIPPNDAGLAVGQMTWLLQREEE